MSYICMSIKIVVRKVIVATATITASETVKKEIITDLEAKVRRELHIPPQITVIGTVIEQHTQRPGDGFYPEFNYTGNKVELGMDNKWTKQKKLNDKIKRQQEIAKEHRIGHGQNKGTGGGGKVNHYTNPQTAAKKARKNAQRKGR